MNIYFLVEGRHTEIKVYPKWLALLIPELKQVRSFDQVSQKNYYIFSGHGYPALLDNHLRNCIEDVNNNGHYDYLIMCLDGDDIGINARKKEVLDFIADEKLQLNNTKFEIIVQNKCIETWFLGNQKIFKRNPESDFLKTCIAFYDVSKDDPELMEKPLDYENSVSFFHHDYLRDLLEERNIRYTKSNPNDVVEKHYLDELKKRSSETSHIASFRHFIDLCGRIRAQI